MGIKWKNDCIYLSAPVHSGVLSALGIRKYNIMYVFIYVDAVLAVLAVLAE